MYKLNILVYVELAHFASLVPGMADKQYATKQYLYDQIQHYNENVLNQTRYNMNGAPLICPSNDILDLILQLSLQAEEHLVPNDYYHRNGKEDIIYEFDTYYRNTTKLCALRGEDVLKYDTDQVWLSFFKSL